MGSVGSTSYTSVVLFVNYTNYNHSIPTRYVIKGNLEFKNVVNDEKMVTLKSHSADR